MRFYEWLFTRDQRWNNWIFHKESGEDGPVVQLRERYMHLPCPACGKFDEFKALELGFDEDVRIRARKGTDLVGSDDGLICASSSARALLEDSRVRGVEFLPLPDSDFSVMIPTEVIHVKPEGVGQMTLEKQCLSCWRFAETVCMPLFTADQFPEEPLTALAPELHHENHRGRDMDLMISPEVLALMKGAKLRGFYTQGVGVMM